MPGKPSSPQKAAEKQYHKAPTDKKPTVRELADKHKISESAIYSSEWWKNRAQPKPGENQ